MPEMDEKELRLLRAKLIVGGASREEIDNLFEYVYELKLKVTSKQNAMNLQNQIVDTYKATVEKLKDAHLFISTLGTATPEMGEFYRKQLHLAIKQSKSVLGIEV